MADAPLLGQVLAGYRILEVIGEGGMGVVYRAEHTTIGKQVAIKVLQRHYAHMPDVLARFIREAKAVNDIRHENVIDILGFDHTEDKEPYILMEFLEGQSLAAVLDTEAPFSTERTTHIGLQICSALFAAHEQGIVHRDLKGDNVFLTKKRAKKDFVKLFDFGIAKLLNNGLQESGQTRTGAFVGTPLCTAPEQADGGVVDARTDIYAFGVLLHQMATGAPPFYDKNPHLLIALHLTAALPPPREKNPKLHPELEQIIIRCLAKKPADRFQSMRDVAEALAEITNKDLGSYYFPEETIKFKSSMVRQINPPTDKMEPSTAVDIRLDATQITAAPEGLQPKPTPLAKETTDSLATGEAFDPSARRSNKTIKLAALAAIPVAAGIIGVLLLGSSPEMTEAQTKPLPATKPAEEPKPQPQSTPSTAPIEEPTQPTNNSKITKTPNKLTPTAKDKTAGKTPDKTPDKTEKNPDKGFKPLIPFQP